MGAVEVGKTSIVRRFVNKYFNESYEPTQHDLRPYRVLMNASTEDSP